jgi:hypothetical protein
VTKRAKPPGGRQAGKTTSIPPELEDAILDQAGKGMSLRALEEWLRTEHKVDAGRNAIGRFLAKRRAERSEITRAVTVQKLAGSVISDLDRLEEIRGQVAAKASVFDDGIEILVETLQKASEELKKHGDLDGERASKMARVMNSMTSATQTWTKLKELELKTVDTKLHYSGADGGDGQQNETLGDFLALGFESEEGD